jgi:hypothetical protein
MRTFKQFLLETMKVPPKTTPLEVKEAIDLLNKHCKMGLAAIAQNGVLYRGYEYPHNVQLVDSTNSVRTSKDTNNAYQIFMDKSIPLKGYASRSNSFICSTDIRTAGNYDKVFVMVPFDGTVLTVSREADFINTAVGNNYFDFTDLQDISDKLYNTVYMLSENEGQTISAEYIEDVLSNPNVTPELILLAVNAFCSEGRLIKTDPLSALSEILDDISDIGNFFDVRANEQKYIEEAVEHIKNKGPRTPGGNKLLAALRACPLNERLTVLASLMLTPAGLGLRKVKYGVELRENVECWFSGKAIAISYELFSSILNEMNKMKTHKIHAEVQHVADINNGYV